MKAKAAPPAMKAAPAPPAPMKSTSKAVPMKISVMKSGMKVAKEEPKKTFFVCMSDARKANKKSFTYNGNTYTKKKGEIYYTKV